MVSEPECGQGEHVHSKVTRPGCRNPQRVSSGHDPVQAAKAQEHGYQDVQMRWPSIAQSI